MMQSTHSSASSHSTSDNNNIPSSQTMNDSPDTKILRDLSTLSEQIALCQSMLASTSDADNHNEALLTVIGFLEACAPRMLELIEIAAQGDGILKDETFEQCLLVNDKLTNVLADLENPSSMKSIHGGGEEGVASLVTTAATAASLGNDEDEMNFGIEHLSMDQSPIGAGGGGEVVGGKTSGLDASEDLLGVDLNNDNESKLSGEAMASFSDNDDFDSFFRDRTQAP